MSAITLGVKASGLFNAYFLPSSGVSHFQSERFSSMLPLDMDGPDSLREFGLRDFLSPCSHNPPKCRISKEGDLSQHVLIDGLSRFTSRLWVFGI
jgi:hypothetical protein